MWKFLLIALAVLAVERSPNFLGLAMALILLGLAVVLHLRQTLQRESKLVPPPEGVSANSRN